MLVLLLVLLLLLLLVVVVVMLLLLLLLPLADAFSMKTTATFDEATEEYSITGSKMWISNAEHAGVFLVMANAAPEQGYKGIVSLVSSEAKGREQYSNRE